jgi:hypothetical protein
MKRRAWTWALPAAMTLAGCGGAQPAFPAQPALHRASARSEAQKRTALLYVLDANDYTGSETLDVFTYPGARPISNIETAYGSNGLCIDSSGDVYVAQPYDVVEYRHGETTPVRTLQSPYTSAGQSVFVSCAVNQSTGDVAVVSASDLGGAVLIYPGGSSDYKEIPVETTASLHYCAYDLAGNLYLLEATNGVGVARLKVLSHGLDHFRSVAIAGSTDINGYKGIQYVDDRLVLAALQSGVLRFRTYQEPPRVEQTGETELPVSDVGQFFIDRTRIVVPDAESAAVYFYQYPSGKFAKAITGFTYPVASVVSQ